MICLLKWGKQISNYRRSSQWDFLLFQLLFLFDFSSLLRNNENWRLSIDRLDNALLVFRFALWETQKSKPTINELSNEVVDMLQIPKLQLTLVEAAEIDKQHTILGGPNWVFHLMIIQFNLYAKAPRNALCCVRLFFYSILRHMACKTIRYSCLASQANYLQKKKDSSSQVKRRWS